MKTRIVWMSQHTPTKRQRAALTAIFPSHLLIIDHRSFDGADDIVARFRKANADEMVVVAPLTVVRELVKRGIRPIYAEMRQLKCDHPEVEVRASGRCYKFLRFSRVTDVLLKLEEVNPTTAATIK